MPASAMCAGVSKSGSPAPQADDVLALGLEMRGARGDGERGRGLDALDALASGMVTGSTGWPRTRLRYGKAFCVAIRTGNERAEAI